MALGHVELLIWTCYASDKMSNRVEHRKDYKSKLPYDCIAGTKLTALSNLMIHLPCQTQLKENSSSGMKLTKDHYHTIDIQRETQH